MNPDATHLLAEALRLPDNQRAELAARLIDSLDPSVDDDVESAWSAEIQARLEELQSGQVQPVPWPEARRLILEDRDDTGQD